MSAYANAERQADLAPPTDVLFGQDVGLSAHDLFVARSTAAINAAEIWRTAELRKQARAAKTLCLWIVLDAYGASSDALSLKLPKSRRLAPDLAHAHHRSLGYDA